MPYWLSDIRLLHTLQARCMPAMGGIKKTTKVRSPEERVRVASFPVSTPSFFFSHVTTCEKKLTGNEVKCG